MLSFASVSAGMEHEAPSPKGPDSTYRKTLRVDTNRYWYLLVGVANDWPRLHESEHEINRDVNRFFGSFVPRWHRPTTFKDWRDDLRLWDLHGGLARSLSNRWSVFLVTGGITGAVRTKNGYFLGVPFEVHSKFERRVLFLSTGADYYPWGKASLPETAERNQGLKQRLFAAKPYLQMALGYSNVYAVGQVKVSLPWVGSVAKGKHAEYYDLFFLSPRLGVDIPLNEKDTLSLMAGYLFYTRHPDEFNGPSFFITYKRKF